MDMDYQKKRWVKAKLRCYRAFRRIADVFPISGGFRYGDTMKFHHTVDVTQQVASDEIERLLLSDSPCMISRFGSFELDTLLNYICIKRYRGSPVKAMLAYATRREAYAPFWHPDTLKHIKTNAGFFDEGERALERLCEIYFDYLPDVDLLGSWVDREFGVREFLRDDVIHVKIQDLEPYRHDPPWSRVLYGKRILVVHPFESTIRMQYSKRTEIFDDRRVLPEFELLTLPAVQSIAGNRPKEYSSWFAAYTEMCAAISRHDFDIALIGAGAYGLPLAGYVKRLGRKAVHLGGNTQILFGIKGHRWDDNPEYRDRFYKESWIRPLPQDIPPNHGAVEDGCYW